MEMHGKILRTEFMTELESRTLFSVPAAPSSLKASVPSSTQIKLTWNDNSSNEKAFTILRGTSSSNVSQIATTSANREYFYDTPPSKTTTYYYKIRAYNDSGRSSTIGPVSAKVSSSSSSTTTKSSTTPSAPSSLKVAKYSSSQIKFSWTDNSGIESGFKVYRGTSSSSLSQIATLGKNVTSYISTPPSKTTTYYYTVRAYNSSATSSQPSPVSFKLSTATSGSTGSSSNVKIINIGPNRSVKSLNSASWPAAGDAPVKFVLDYSSTAYSLSQHYVYGNLTIESADPSKPATIKLPATYKNGIASNPTINVKGTLTIRDIKTTGGEDTVLLGSSTSANILAERVKMDGGGMWLGSGGNTIIFHDNEVAGIPRAYVYANFNNHVNKVVIDNSHTSAPVRQGGHIINGQPVGEAAIRVMNVEELQLTGITTKPWFYKSGQEWKQDVQLRPDSHLITVTNCHFYQPDIGDMLWRSPALPIDKVVFNNTTFVKMPSITPGVGEVDFNNCKVGSTTINKTVT
jgi:hypothetical protein